MEQLVDAVLLDANQNVQSALEKVARSRHMLVVVRRAEDARVYWYSFSADEARRRLAQFKAEDSVVHALDLHEHDAARVREVGTTMRAVKAGDTVVLDGPRFVGVLPERNASGGERGRAAPEPPVARRSGSGVRTTSSIRIRRSADFADEFDEQMLEMAHASTAKRESEAPPSCRPTQSAFLAYPRLEAPEWVAPCARLAVDVGLGSTVQHGMQDGPVVIDLPAELVRFNLDVRIVADGFAMPSGGRHTLSVDRNDLAACSISVPLIAPDQREGPLLTTINATFFYKSVACGSVARRVVVGEPGEIDAAGPSPWVGGAPQPGPVIVRADVPAIDLTVMINKPDGNPTSGQFVWTFESPHDVALPAQPLKCDLGTDSSDFAATVIAEVQNSEAMDMAGIAIAGVGTAISEKVPIEFWQVLGAVAGAVAAQSPGETPTVLFLTAEAHVPWELAWMDEPLDPEAPPFLGCQTQMARWPLSDSGLPALPPPSSIEVEQFAVVTGDYAARSGWRKLEKAKAEGEALVARYQGTPLSADPTHIKKLLTRKVPVSSTHTGAEAVHFACHGEAVAGASIQAAVILENGNMLTPFLLANTALGRQNRPFLFMNACQVGTADQMLGSFSGFAGSSLRGGFRGFLAPLWSVDDALAHDIALEFYERVFGGQAVASETVGSVLQSLRSRFKPDEETGSASRLAYVFYGHPGLLLSRVGGELKWPR